MEKTSKKYYSKEYKLKAVALSEQRGNNSTVAKELGVRTDMLSHWRKEHTQDQKKHFCVQVIQNGKASRMNYPS
jgi:transposase